MAELRLRRTPSWRPWRCNEAEEEEEPEPNRGVERAAFWTKPCIYRHLDGRCFSACIHCMYCYRHQIDRPLGSARLRFRILFFSYQWLSCNQPGPNRIQWECKQAAFEMYRNGNGHGRRKTYVWLDIFSIPRCQFLLDGYI